MGRRDRFADLSYVALIASGFVLIFLGWNGAASYNDTPGQIPYLISGGLAGLAAVFYGCTAMIVRTIKRAQADQKSELQQIASAMKQVASSLSWGGNGNGSESADLVVVGASSFHLPTCRTITGRSEVARLPRTEAESQGLERCRICEP